MTGRSRARRGLALWGLPLLVAVTVLIGCGGDGSGPSFSAPTAPLAHLAASPEPASAESTTPVEGQLPSPPAKTATSSSGASHSPVALSTDVRFAVASPSASEEEEEEEEEGEEEGVQAQQVPCDRIQPTISAVELPSRDVRVSWSYQRERECYWDGFYTVSGPKLSLSGTTDTTRTIPGLKAGRHCYEVRVNAEGAQPATGCVTIPLRLPDDVTNVGATASGATITITWNTATRADTYEVRRKDDSTTKTGISGTTYTWSSGLSAGTEYCFDVQARNSAGTSRNWSTNACATPPVPDCDITGASMDSAQARGTSAELGWSHTDNGHCNAVRYTLFQGGSAIVTGTADKTHTVANLSPGTYTFHVKASDNDDSSESATSAKASVTIACPKPDAPTGLGHSLSGIDVTLTWDPVSVSGCTVAYKVWRGGTYIDPASGTSYTDRGRPAGTYGYRVSAVATSTDGSTSTESDRSDSESVTVPPCGTPAVPGGLTAARRGSTTTIDVSWNRVSLPDGCSSITYVLTRGGNDIARTTGTRHTDRNLDPGTYNYRVSAESSPGSRNSGESGPEEETIPRPGPVSAPATPTGIQTSASRTSITLSWNASTGATGYGIRMEDDDTSRRSVTGTSYTWSGLGSGTEYCFEVRASNAAGSSSWSSPATCATTTVAPPPTPTGVAAAAQSTSEIRITWNGAERATGYEVRKASPAPAETESASGAAYTWTGLDAATRYCFDVRATNSGGKSAWSGEECATTDTEPPPPDAPGNVTATASSSSAISVSWDAVSGADSYEVLRRLESGNYPADSEAASVTGTTREDGGLTASTEYCYQVRTVDGGLRSAWSSEDCATTLVPPPPVGTPSNLVVKAESSSVIKLSWTAGRGATRYEVVRVAGTGARPGETGGFFVDGATSHEDSGRTPNVRYCYRVRSEGNVTWTLERCATTPLGAPDAPGSFTAVAASESTVDLSWDAVSGAESYEVRFRVSGSASWGKWEDSGSGTRLTLSDLRSDTGYEFEVRTVRSGQRSDASSASARTLAPPPDAPGGFGAASESATSVRLSWTAVTGADSYEARRKTGDGEYGKAFSAGDGTHWVDTGLVTGTQYCWQARTVADGRRSSWAAEACATPRAPRLAQPANVAAASSSPVSVTLSWDAVAGAKRYQFRWKQDGGDWSKALNAGTGVSHEHGGRAPGTEYRYQVRAVSAKQKSGWSAKVTATTPRAPLGIPAGLTARALSSVTVELEWRGVTEAERYQLRWRKGRRGRWTRLDPVTRNGDEHPTRTPNTQYQYQVRALGGGRESGWSDAVQVKTPVLETPTGLTAAGASSSAVRLSWDAVAAAESYEVDRMRKSDNKRTEIRVSGTDYEDGELRAETTYEYRVRSVLRRGGERFVSVWSGKVEATTLGETLGVPANLSATARSAFTVGLSWGAVTGATGYEMRRSVTAEETYTVTPVSGTSRDDAELAPNTSYTFQVRAVKGTAMSGWSAEATATTRVFAAPGNFQVAAPDATSMRVSWSAVPETGAQYRLQYRKKGKKKWKSETVSGTSQVVEGLAPDTAYQFRVTAERTSGGTLYRSEVATAQARTPRS